MSDHAVMPAVHATAASPSLGPVAGDERIAVLDVIRGFALFGVLLINVLWSASPELLVPAEVLEALPTAELDRWMGFALYWLIENKAQALFSLLFGIGFALQMERGSARRLDARATYARRLGVLLLLGIAHLLLLWIGDILHAYALMGFLLLVTRRWSDRTLLVGGLLLSCLAFPGLVASQALLARADIEIPAEGVAEAGVERRFAVYLEGDYGAFVAENLRSNREEYIGTPFFCSFLAFIFGRFLLGHWLARRRFLYELPRHAATFQRLLPVTLVAGLLLGLPRTLGDTIGIEWSLPQRLLVSFIGSASMLVLAAGYAMILCLLHLRGRFRRLLDGFAAVGRMALTNYLAQGLFYLFVLYGFGLGLLRLAGATLGLFLSLGFFMLQIAASRWWLERCRFGPAEWVWRGLTYGSLPPLRRPELPSGASSAPAGG